MFRFECVAHSERDFALARQFYGARVNYLRPQSGQLYDLIVRDALDQSGCFNHVGIGRVDAIHISIDVRRPAPL